jgi:hypothetical protein
MKVIMLNFMMLEREILISHMVLETSTKCSFQEGEFCFVDEKCQLCVFSNTSQDLLTKNG